MQPVYTPLSFFKRFLIGQEKELTVDRLLHQLQEFAPYLLQVYSMPVEQLVDDVLHAEQSPFTVDAAGTIRLQEFPLRINHAAFNYLSQVGKPQSLERIIKQVSKKTKIAPQYVEQQLKLEKDMRFVQVVGLERWFLTEWEICNQTIYEILLQQGIRETNSNYVYQIIASEIQKKDQSKRIWVPEIDMRFQIFDNGKVIIREIVEEADKVDHSTGNEILQTAVQQIEQTIAMLEERNQQMATEVVGFFDEQDLEAIRVLMDEKRENMELQQDLLMIMEKWKR